ncbi:hypothetical protein HZC27_00180 [Candidatus Roizmanbacteria bacterium]|nr:hypothetical protein [Candidatus Roizmanbacteria bacterium]
MKTEKICISKKNLIISFIVVFLLGVVGVSYMVQRNLTLRSKANEMDSTYANCRVAFEEIVKPLFGGIYLPQNVATFEDNYVDNNTSNNLVNCAPGQKYIYATSNNDWKSVPGKCCLYEKSKSDEKPVEEGLANIGLSYVAGIGIDESSTPFKKVAEADGKASAITVGNVNDASTCVNYDAPKDSKERQPQACNTGNIKEEECGPNGDNRRYFKVNCGSATGSEGKSCDFKCFNGKDWITCKDDKSNYVASVCLVPTQAPAPTVIPTTFKVVDCKKVQGKEVNHCWIPEKDLILKGTQAMFEGKSYKNNTYLQTKADRQYRLVSRDSSGYEQCVNREGLVGICASIEEKWDVIP